MNNPTPLFDDYKVSLHENLDDIKDVWDEVSPKTDIVLSSKYLKVLEENPTTNGSHLYVLIYQGSKAIGCIYYQAGMFLSLIHI